MDDVDLQTMAALVIRHAMGGVAGWLLATGYVPDTITKQQIIAVGMGVVAIGWSWWQKRGQAVVAAELARLKGKK